MTTFLVAGGVIAIVAVWAACRGGEKPKPGCSGVVVTWTEQRAKNASGSWAETVCGLAMLAALGYGAYVALGWLWSATVVLFPFIAGVCAFMALLVMVIAVITWSES